MQRNAEPRKPPGGPTADARPLFSRYAVPIFLVVLLAHLLFYFTAPAPNILQDRSGNSAELTRIDMALWLVRVRLPSLWADWTGGEADNIGIAGRLGVTLVAAAILLIALAVGWLLLDVLQINGVLNRLEAACFSLAVGLNAVSLLTLTIGLLGLLQNAWAYLVPFGLLSILAGIRCAARVFRPAGEEDEIRTGRETAFTKTDWLRPSVLWLGLPFALIIFAGAMTPPRAFDVREYHLQAPKEWFQQGAITFLPHNVYANMPLGPQILSLPAMAVFPGELNWWWGALVGKVLIAAYVPLTALGLFACGRRFFSTTAGVAAALVYISIPWMAHVSMETYVDGALACYAFLTFYAAAIAVSGRQPSKAVEEGERAWTGSQSRRTWLLAGFLAGAAVSCKYTGMLFVVAPLFFVLIFAPGWREGFSRAALARVGILLVAVLLGCGLWLGKNWVRTGNPTYPLLYGVFGGETRTPEKDQQWRKAHAVPQDAYGRRYTPGQIGAAIKRVAVSSPWISPLLLPLAGFAFVNRQHRRKLLTILGMFAFIIAMWFLFTHRIDRFWLPALPLLALMAGAGVTALDGPWWRRVVIALLFWGLVWNFVVVTGMLAPPKLLVELESLQNSRPRVHPAHVWLNEQVPDGSAVLLVGDAQPFDLQMPVLYNTCFDDCLLEEWMQGKSKEERLAALRQRNISQVFVQWSEIDRYRSPGNYGFTDYVTQDVFDELVAQGVLKKPLGQRVAATGDPHRWVGEIYPVAQSDGGEQANRDRP